MNSRHKLLLNAAALFIFMPVHSAAGAECLLDWSRPACGKVCKLVCEKKKLTAICYGCKCNAICIPAPSRQGCKHCATCCGDHACDPCASCQAAAPKCEFCWYDWFACGCAQPRSVKVLTKYQAEKEVCWYHWEVVDAACCDGVSKNDATVPGGQPGNGLAADAHCLYKPAPENAEVGDVLPVSDEEWVQLVALLTPDKDADHVPLAGGTVGSQPEQPTGAELTPKAPEQSSSLAEKMQRLFSR